MRDSSAGLLHEVLHADHWRVGILAEGGLLAGPPAANWIKDARGFRLPPAHRNFDPKSDGASSNGSRFGRRRVAQDLAAVLPERRFDINGREIAPADGISRRRVQDRSERQEAAWPYESVWRARSRSPRPTTAACLPHRRRPPRQPAKRFGPRSVSPHCVPATRTVEAFRSIPGWPLRHRREQWLVAAGRARPQAESCFRAPRRRPLFLRLITYSFGHAPP